MTLQERAAAFPAALRRRLIPVVCLLGLIGIANPLPPAAVFAANPVVTENQQAGTPGWQLGSMVADDATGQIKGYASATSVSQNQSVAFYVTVNPPQNFDMDFYRIR